MRSCVSAVLSWQPNLRTIPSYHNVAPTVDGNVCSHHFLLLLRVPLSISYDPYARLAFERMGGPSDAVTFARQAVRKARTEATRRLVD